MKFKGLTNIGKRHLAKIHANNGTLEFTKIKFGDGTLKANEEPLDLVQVKNFKIEQEILGAEQNDNITSIETVIDNLNITYGFHVREFGIYVKDGNDEILYYYMNDDTEASWMPPASDGPHKMEIKINMVMSNTTSVVVNTEDHDLYLTKSYFLKRLAEKMNNIIQKTGFNLHKSDSANSNDTNTLATSLAVKTAHDKATEALNIANTKEPSFSKRTGHNLDKTDEYNLDDANKLATAKALKKLFDEIIKRIGAIKLTWSAITGKPNFSSSVSSNTENEFATPKSVKTAYDKGVEALNKANTKLNISDAWRIHYKEIGSTTTAIDFNTLIEAGFYRSQAGGASGNKWLHFPVGLIGDGAFVAQVMPLRGIGSSTSKNYVRQIVYSYSNNNIVTRISSNEGKSWTNWERIDVPSLVAEINKKLNKAGTAEQLGFKNGNVGIFVGSNNEINFESGSTGLWFNYRTIGANKISGISIGDGSGTGSKGDITCRNLNNENKTDSPDEANSSKLATARAVYNLKEQMKSGLYNLQQIGGHYSGSGGKQPPLFVGSGKVRFSMSNEVINNNSDFKDWIYLDTYAGGDVPYVNAVGFVKNGGNPRMFLMKGAKNGSTWDKKAEVWTTANFDHSEIIGKNYGGVLNNAGAKTAGKTYFDNNTKKLFLCKNNNSDTSANVANYIALDNNSLLERLENLPKLILVYASFGTFLNGTNITIPIPASAKFQKIMIIIFQETVVTQLLKKLMWQLSKKVV